MKLNALRYLKDFIKIFEGECVKIYEVEDKIWSWMRIKIWMREGECIKIFEGEGEVDFIKIYNALSYQKANEDIWRWMH